MQPALHRPSRIAAADIVDGALAPALARILAVLRRGSPWSSAVVIFAGMEASVSGTEINLLMRKRVGRAAVACIEVAGLADPYWISH
jgi:hypothetical protein